MKNLVVCDECGNMYIEELDADELQELEEEKERFFEVHGVELKDEDMVHLCPNCKRGIVWLTKEK